MNKSEKILIMAVHLAAVMLLLTLTAFAASPSGDLTRQYELEFHTSQVDETGPFNRLSLSVLSKQRIQLVTRIMDGGGISQETLIIKAATAGKDGVTTLDLLYTLDGQPCKALFTRELKAKMHVPDPGVYRVKLWINELYYNKGEILLGEKEIRVE